MKLASYMVDGRATFGVVAGDGIINGARCLGGRFSTLRQVLAADALERAESADPRKVREALASLDVSSGYAAMAPGGRVKFGPDGKNIYGRPVGVQWQNGDLVSVFPKEDARAPLLKT